VSVVKKQVNRIRGAALLEKKKINREQSGEIMKSINNEKGFTLVEIAIVLVIIGLLLGGVLKGQELIDNGKVKRAASDFNGIVAAYNSYIDRYNRLPGDDGNLAALTARGGSWTSITQGGNNNGVITVSAANTFTGGDENDNFWQHLKAAGFINGNPADAGIASLPRNPFGGLTGITNAAVMAGGGSAAMTGNKVCMSQVPGKIAINLDNQLDDGIPNSGSFRATQAVVGANTIPGGAAATYNEGLVYTVCRIL
jgi:prepilin-type N-terminal cleavage/methylation domain-containing protein